MESCLSNGTLLGSKVSPAHVIPTATRVDERVLSDTSRAQTDTIRQKMSWAVGREITRGECRAYSLMGLLDVKSLI